MKIDVLIPTRERPHLALRTAQSALKTCEEKDRLRIFIGIDCDEPCADEYRKVCAENNIGLLIAPTTGSAPKCIDWMWRQTDGDVLVVGTDDVIFRTQGWDQYLAKQFTRQPYIVISPNDGRKRRKLEQPIVTRKWAELAGCLFPPFHHFCADEWVEKIASKTGLLCYSLDITMEHMHPKYGKAEWDNVYLRKRDEAGHARQMEDKERLIASADDIEQIAARISAAAAKYLEAASA